MSGISLGDNKTLWRRATYQTFLPVLAGLFLAFLFVLIVDLLSPAVWPLWYAEILLARLALKVRSLSDPGIVYYGAILLGIVILNTYWKRFQLLKPFLRLKTQVEFAGYALLTASSFTFFAQYPTELEFRESVRLSLRYQGLTTEEDLKKREELARDRKLIADLLAAKARSLSTQTLADLRAEIAGIRRYARPLEYERVVDSIVQDTITEINKSAPKEKKGDDPPKRETPATKEEQSEVQRLEKESDEGVDALRELVTSSLGKLLPEETHIFQVYLNKVILDFAEDFFEHHVPKEELPGKSLSLPRWFDAVNALLPIRPGDISAEAGNDLAAERAKEIRDYIRGKREAVRDAIVADRHGSAGSDFYDPDRDDVHPER